MRKFWLYNTDGGSGVSTGNTVDNGGTGSGGASTGGATGGNTGDDAKALQARLDAIQKEREAEAAELKQFRDAKQKEDDAKKTLEQKLADAELKNKQLELSQLKTKIAIEKGLKPELIDRLQGDDQKSLEADADKLLTLFKPAEGSGAVGDRTQPGKPKTGSNLSFMDELRQKQGVK